MQTLHYSTMMLLAFSGMALGAHQPYSQFLPSALGTVVAGALCCILIWHWRRTAQRAMV